MSNPNPYSSPNDTHAVSKSAPNRLTRMLVMCIGVGTIAAIFVYVGDAFQWPHFNRRAGYIGTEFISDILYAINDPYAIHIVAFLWFMYATLATGILAYSCRVVLRKR